MRRSLGRHSPPPPPAQHAETLTPFHPWSLTPKLHSVSKSQRLLLPERTLALLRALMLNSRPKPVSPASSSGPRARPHRRCHLPTAVGLTDGGSTVPVPLRSPCLSAVSLLCTFSHSGPFTPPSELRTSANSRGKGCTSTDSKSLADPGGGSRQVGVWQAARARAASGGDPVLAAAAWPQGLSLSTCYCKGDAGHGSFISEPHTDQAEGGCVLALAVQLRGGPRAVPHGAAPGRPRAFDKRGLHSVGYFGA